MPETASFAFVFNTSRVVEQTLYIPDNKDLYDHIHENKEAFEKAAGFPFEWDRLDEKKPPAFIFAFRQNKGLGNEVGYYILLL